jgi:hypothetical protein
LDSLGLKGTASNLGPSEQEEWVVSEGEVWARGLKEAGLLEENSVRKEKLSRWPALTRVSQKNIEKPVMEGMNNSPVPEKAIWACQTWCRGLQRAQTGSGQRDRLQV